MHYHFYFSTLSVMSFSVQWHLMKYSSVFLHAECSVQSNTYDIFGEFARTKRVVLLSLHEIMKSIPINCSHHRCLLFPLPICHVICHTKFWKQNSLGGGFWIFFLISMMRSLAWSDLQQGQFAGGHRPCDIETIVRHVPLEKVDHFQDDTFGPPTDDACRWELPMMNLLM